jgi:hypothetical protein
MVAPQVPTRWAVGQTVLDHESHRQIDHAVGVLTARWRQSRQVSLEVLRTFRPIVLRIGDDELPWTPEVEIAQVVQRPPVLLVPIGLVTTPRTRLTRVGATGKNDLWWWQVCNCGHPFGGIGSIRTRTEHGCILRAHMFGPALYDKCPTGAIPRPGIDAIVSFSCPYFGTSLWHSQVIVFAAMKVCAKILEILLANSEVPKFMCHTCLL